MRLIRGMVPSDFVIAHGQEVARLRATWMQNRARPLLRRLTRGDSVKPSEVRDVLKEYLRAWPSEEPRTSP